MTAKQHNRTITLLVQDLRRLIAVAQTRRRFPALELALSRGQHFRAEAQSSDHFRFQLFGIEPDGQLPVAAVTRAADSGHKPDQKQYWLRTDPVTLWADMARVMITSYGLVDLDEFERNEIENTIRSVLLEEGIHLHADHPERWSIALQEPIGTNFTPIVEALGMDLAEAMQENPESMHWRRIMNEIEIALHSSPVNLKRRQMGQPEINSVWFWGGGFIPDASEHHVFDAVYSDHPVSRGLAAINDCKLMAQDDFFAEDLDDSFHSILLDWSVNPSQPEVSLIRLEEQVENILTELTGTPDRLAIYCGRNDGWSFGSSSKRRFWRRIRTLDDLCTNRYPA